MLLTASARDIGHGTRFFRIRTRRAKYAIDNTQDTLVRTSGTCGTRGTIQTRVTWITNAVCNAAAPGLGVIAMYWTVCTMRT
jgi:hypothetical protein